MTARSGTLPFQYLAGALAWGWSCLPSLKRTEYLSAPEAIFNKIINFTLQPCFYYFLGLEYFGILRLREVSTSVQGNLFLSSKGCGSRGANSWLPLKQCPLPSLLLLSFFLPDGIWTARSMNCTYPEQKPPQCSAQRQRSRSKKVQRTI